MEKKKSFPIHQPKREAEAPMSARCRICSHHHSCSHTLADQILQGWCCSHSFLYYTNVATSAAKPLSWTETEEGLVQMHSIWQHPSLKSSVPWNISGEPTTLTKIHWIKESCPNREVDVPLWCHFRSTWEKRKQWFYMIAVQNHISELHESLAMHSLLPISPA